MIQQKRSDSAQRQEGPEAKATRREAVPSCLIRIFRRISGSSSSSSSAPWQLSLTPVVLESRWESTGKRYRANESVGDLTVSSQFPSVRPEFMELGSGTCFEQVCADVGMAAVGGNISSNFMTRAVKSCFTQISSRHYSRSTSKQYSKAELFKIVFKVLLGMHRVRSLILVYLLSYYQYLRSDIHFSVKLIIDLFCLVPSE